MNIERKFVITPKLLPEQHYSYRNSNIYKNITKECLYDLSDIGTLLIDPADVLIEQEKHGFFVGDVLYFDIKAMKFDRAIARNTIESEVCGIISEVIDINTFKMINHGVIQTDRYNFAINSPLYLSEMYRGKLVSIEPKTNVIQIGIQQTNSIKIDIVRGFQIADSTEEYDGTLEPYTKEELDEIIKNIW